MKVVKVLRVINKYVRLDIRKQDGFCWLKVNNGPFVKITQEEYDILSEWMDNDK